MQSNQIATPEIINMQQESAELNCPICFTEYPPNQFIKFKCNHQCCLTCWKYIISAANSNFKVKDIECFEINCKHKLENIDDLVLNIEDKEIVNRFHYLKKKQQIVNDKSKFICPNTDCQRIIDSSEQDSARKNYKSKTNLDDVEEIKIIKDLDYSFLICNDCDNIFCKVCEVYHPPGKATCLKRVEAGSEIILKVSLSSWIFFYFIHVIIYK